MTPDETAVEDIEESERESSGVRRARRRHNSRRNAVEWIAVVAGALLVAIVIKTFLFQAFYIPSPSMEPTLEVGDRPQRIRNGAVRRSWVQSLPG